VVSFPISAVISVRASAVGSCLSLAKPKSSSFAPDFVSMILPGFKSRWMTPWRWALSSASEIWMANSRTCSVRGTPRDSRCSKVSPSTYSMTRKSTPS